MSKLSPIESEFATSEDAEAHDAWFRAKVQVALASTKAGLPHDQVMAEARHLIESKRDAAARLAS
ncbi:MAG: stability determinant [Sphingomonas bacterium]|uniref:type II toxin-antitoxin system RelB family antitoxin n=1 Tax=Sphingomonas bacterium TaxID=1895847 RepID=UPI002608F512|nr:stability determinant [Sphingomonas bacterium]MDB5695098.1 stability determinant [Sphingomonas bacterium]